MIAGKQIAEELSKLIGSGGYDPNTATFSRRLPQTMRQLIEGDFDIEDTNIDSDSLRPQINFKAGPCRRNFSRPVFARQLSIKRPVPPSIKCDDYRGYHTLLSSFYVWLKRKRKAGHIDIDHHLENETWPLWERFAQEVKERTGWHVDDFFPQEEWQACDTVEPQDWSAAWMPLYNLDMEEDAVPLLEFLSGYRTEQFPEAAFDGRDVDEVCRAGKIMDGIIERRKYDELPQEWATAYKALDKYGNRCIAYTEPDETKMEILNADDLDEFFKAAKEVADMIRGTSPLVRKCNENSDKFWDEIIAHLLGLPIRKKRKLKPQNLIQVFNEEKIQVRV